MKSAVRKPRPPAYPSAKVQRGLLRLHHTWVQLFARTRPEPVLQQAHARLHSPEHFDVPAVHRWWCELLQLVMRFAALAVPAKAQMAAKRTMCCMSHKQHPQPVVLACWPGRRLQEVANEHLAQEQAHARLRSPVHFDVPAVHRCLVLRRQPAAREWLWPIQTRRWCGSLRAMLGVGSARECHLLHAQAA